MRPFLRLVSLALTTLISIQAHAQIANMGNAPTTNQPPPFLGVNAANDTPSPFTPNNTGVQSAQLYPSLATPFVNLQTIPDETVLKNAIPGNISRLIREKNYDEALEAIEKFLKANPKNIQLAFVRSRIYVEQGQLEKARQILVEITEKFPELPEPYNNLAVLYASAGRLDLARENLEMCVKLAPNHAIALQNLGDLYTRIAAANYAKAYQLNRRFVDAERKRKLAEAVTAPKQ